MDLFVVVFGDGAGRAHVVYGMMIVSIQCCHDQLTEILIMSIDEVYRSSTLPVDSGPKAPGKVEMVHCLEFCIEKGIELIIEEERDFIQARHVAKRGIRVLVCGNKHIGQVLCWGQSPRGWQHKNKIVAMSLMSLTVGAQSNDDITSSCVDTWIQKTYLPGKRAGSGMSS
eukprot:5864700-Ditylum_brightwellii.AAC.1